MRTDPPTLFRNPYSWSRLANVLILNGPAPVGFSYCNPAGPGGDGRSCGSWNDTRTNDFNTVFVERFFDLFPEYALAPFFVTGESYAGVYTGMLVDSLLNKRSAINVRGLALGDACMGTEVLCGQREGGPWLSLLFTAGQGCVSLATFNAILELCPLKLLQDGPMSAASPACAAAVARAEVDCPGSAYYSYNYLDQCPPDPFSSASGAVEARAGVTPPAPAQPSGYPCGGDAALKAWITRADTKKALNVAANSAYWSFDNGEGFVYNVTWPSNLPLLRRLQTGKDGVRVLVYNGETDPSVSSVRSQKWSYALGFPVEQAWRPWTFPNSSTVAGQIVQWEGNFKHATIRGSGHMVPGECRGTHRGASMPPAASVASLSPGCARRVAPRALLTAPPPFSRLQALFGVPDAADVAKRR